MTVSRYTKVAIVILTIFIIYGVHDSKAWKFSDVEDIGPVWETEDTMSAQSRRGDKVHLREMTGPNPIVRIGLAEEYDQIRFQINGTYDIVTLGGEVLATGLTSNQRWRVIPDSTEESRAIYSILTTTYAKRDQADKMRRSLNKDELGARVAEVGAEIRFDGRLVANNIKYRVLIGRWATEREAKHALVEYQAQFQPRLVRQVVKFATGTIELINEDNSSFKVIEDGFRIVPTDDSTNFTLFKVREGTGFQWEQEVDRSYPGVLEIRVDHRGLLMAIDELPLEEYLKGVVPSEMPATYPLEALKAQAVAARSETIAKIGAKHLNDPFDLCAHVHCQAYTGLTKQTAATDSAVEATRGEMLTINNKVVEAVYSACCGGHLEDKAVVWNPPNMPHLIAHWDSPDVHRLNQIDLTKERDLRNWVDSSPSVWCNPSLRKGLPPSLVRSELAFRWDVTYSRYELEDIIRKKTGEDFGELIDIIPLKRGKSGRLIEIEIQGTKKNLTIQRELNIRNVLSNKYLRSACFYIEVITSPQGQPVQFKIKGAGFGHGVGMCQVGAGIMGFSGKTYREIIKHYYPGTIIDKVYAK